MKLLSTLKFTTMLFLLLNPSYIFATSLSKPLLIEKTLSYGEAKKLGFKAEITSAAVRDELLEFRISVPEKVNENKIESILSEIFSYEHSVALIELNSYSEEKRNFLSNFNKSGPVHQKYFYMNINPNIVSKVVLNIFCSESLVYILEVETKKL